MKLIITALLASRYPQPISLQETIGELEFFGSLIKTSIDNEEAEQIVGADSEKNTIEARAQQEILNCLTLPDLTRSLAQKPIFELGPLHKRVLSLIEYIILPILRKKQNKIEASAVWTGAFTATNAGPGLDKKKKPFESTLEVRGTWLIEARHRLQDSTDLSDLLDRMIKGLVPLVRPVNITLSATPAAHARQLKELSERGNKAAAYAIMCLGKLAIELRNFVEHGTEEVNDGSLVIQNVEFWTKENQELDWASWCEQEADTKKWRNQAALNEALKKYPRNPKWDPPKSLTSLVMGPESLHRCLTLMSLVLHGAFSHLKQVLGS